MSNKGIELESGAVSDWRESRWTKKILWSGGRDVLKDVTHDRANLHEPYFLRHAQRRLVQGGKNFFFFMMDDV